MPEVLLIRHAQSEANAAGIWNGRSDGLLSEIGEASLDALGKRLSDQHFDLVISSPLSRTRRTAESFTSDFEISDDFIEMSLGQWEGRSREEVWSSSRDYLRQAIVTRILPMGETGETLEEVGRRAIEALDRVADRLGEDGRGVIVTHGGIIQALLHRHLPPAGQRVHTMVGNTSITRIIWSYDRPRLGVFNDLGHLGPRPSSVQEHLGRGEPVIGLIRHGQTRANTEARWQGQGDWGLDELGHRQARALRDWYGPVSTVYASPLGRAHTTATYLAADGVVDLDGLKEIRMGLWEGLTSPEIMDRWSELMSTIYRDGVDLRRGETGETWGELTGRVRATVHGVKTSVDEPTLVVAHGGAIRSYVSSLTSTRDSHAESLFTPANTSVTHLAMTEDGPLLLDYAVSAHLETLT